MGRADPEDHTDTNGSDRRLREGQLGNCQVCLVDRPGQLRLGY